MTTADKLLTNAHVLTMNPNGDLFPNGAVALAGNLIVAVGPAADLTKQFPAAETIDCKGRALLPGLVNAHTHVPMTLLRGMADDLRLDVWLLGYVMPVEREFVSPDFVRLGSLLACAEMVRSGVTAFADMYYFEDHIAQATAEAGLRAVCSQTVLKFPSPDATSYEDSLAAARDYIAKWKGHALIVPSVAPHAPYTCTVEILRACAALAVEYDVPLHTHIAETALEVQDSKDQHGMRVVPWVKENNLLEARVLAAHCVHIDDSEMSLLASARAGVSHNPTSNLKLASGAAPVAKMLAYGLNVGIGTDGPASNNDLDMFEEMRLAAILAKGTAGDPTVLPARTALEMATRLGANALHIGDLTGSLEAGKRADLILVDLDTTHNLPHFDHDPQAVYSQIVYAAKSTDVTDVMVDGKWLMRDRQLLTLNEAALLQAARYYSKRVDTFLIEREQSVLSKLVAIGGLAREESFEVQVKARLADPAQVMNVINHPPFSIVRTRHYREYDTYFSFDPPEASRLRYREDEFVNDKGAVTTVRDRLTLIGPSEEAEFTRSTLLWRSRFIAPAQHSLRFYREYFKPAREHEIHKDRLRWLINYKGIEFFINLDKLTRPAHEGYYLEVKSRTWSKRDAELKAKLIEELLALFGLANDATLKEEYVEMLTN